MQGGRQLDRKPRGTISQDRRSHFKLRPATKGEIAGRHLIARFLVPSRLHSRPNICLLPKSGTEFDDCDECHKDPCGTSHTTTWLQARLRRTLLVWVLGTPAKRWTAACSLRGSIPLSSARPSNQIGT